MIQSLLLKVLRRCGYSLVSNRRFDMLRQLEHYKPAAAPFTEHVRRLLGTLKVDCVFDVGANDGGFARWLRTEVGYTGHIVSFEPIPRHARALQDLAASDSSWQVRALALGRESGQADFHVMASDVFSSFLPPSDDQPARYSDSNKIAQTIPVTISTVSAVWREVKAAHGLTKLYLKMDTQGYDLEVFAGAAEVQEDIVALQSELSMQRLYSGSAAFEEAMSAFLKAGFQASLLHPISMDENLAAIEMDGVFVKQKPALPTRVASGPEAG